MTLRVLILFDGHKVKWLWSQDIPGLTETSGVGNYEPVLSVMKFLLIWSLARLNVVL